MIIRYKLITQKIKYLLLLFPLVLYSCNTCSHSGYTNMSEEDNSIDEDEYTKNNLSPLLSVGHPVISDTLSSEIINRICYTVSYNKYTRQPNWVMWQLTANHVMKRKDGVWNEYREDLSIHEKYRACLIDYANSGYDRGHMCPGGDCNWSDEGRNETFLLSNMCPQNPNLNRGDWKEIEIACRKWAQKYGCLYIVCGPIFLKSQEHERIGPNKIPVPEAFFKVILCDNPLKGIGFICRNTDGNRKKDFYVNSIRQIERVTGYDFFPILPDSIKNVVETCSDLADWD